MELKKKKKQIKVTEFMLWKLQKLLYRMWNRFRNIMRDLTLQKVCMINVNNFFL